RSRPPAPPAPGRRTARGAPARRLPAASSPPRTSASPPRKEEIDRRADPVKPSGGAPGLAALLPLSVCFERPTPACVRIGKDHRGDAEVPRWRWVSLDPTPDHGAVCTFNDPLGLRILELETKTEQLYQDEGRSVLRGRMQEDIRAALREKKAGA